MSLCARCTGVLAGQAAAGAALVVLVAFQATHWVSAPAVWLVGALSLLACAADWAVQEYAGRASTNPRRVVTGLAGGAGLVALAAVAGRTALGAF